MFKTLFSQEDEHTQKKYQQLLGLFAFSLLVFMLGLFSEYLRPVLAFERGALDAGQLWRLLTSHFVHLGSNHMFMNLSVYILTSLIFSSMVSVALWYGVLALCSLSVGVGLYYLFPEVSGYVGLSGVIYAMLAFGLLIKMATKQLVYFAVYILLMYRVIVQQRPDYLPADTVAFIGGNVIVAAHLIGLVAGSVCAIMWCLWRHLAGKYWVSE